MIQATELRIGNWVESANKNSVQILEVLTSMALIHTDPYLKNSKSMTVNLCGLNPIPLTPEILEKAGFVKDYNDYPVDHEDYCEWMVEMWPVVGELVTSSNGEYVFDTETDTLRIKYLHQLQNLYFALHGQELSIQL